MIYDGNLRDVTNYVSDQYLKINSCNIQKSMGQDYTVIRERGRVDYHVLYVAEGECLCEYREQTARLRAGDFVLYAPHERQRYSFMENTAATTFWVHFSGTGAAQLLSSLGLSGGIFRTSSLHDASHFFQRMIRAHTVNLPSGRVSAIGYLLNLLSVLASTAAASDISDKTVSAMLEYVHLHWQEQIRIADVANAVHLSESYAMHRFRKYMGKSLHRYVEELKVSSAASMLRETDMSISEISAMVGYDDPLYFSRVFSKLTRESPSHYRTTHQ